ncbi:Protein of unknown function [Paenibacillus uliginis N3/975]|uniref:Uncharacterized protein n=1 Tax=Paenibacillus uliginis N3/975 TaxID=1313296 RepID=A0A1X7HF72_9BACL|nr:DUF3888 domain-containing protein [Paenibacillus uliginis]SMF85573.1 Protein of unknown function [Paenibacillus uliginis N3/975]
MWWKVMILILAIGVTNCTITDCAKAYHSEESPSKYNADIQRKCLEEVLIFELRPKIMSVLKKEYDNYLIDSAHIIPIRKSDSYPQQEFILKGRVTKQDSTSDIVQITFKASTDGYQVSDFHAIRNENN